MQYARVRTHARDALVALEMANWGAPYRKLFHQTDTSGWELWQAYSHNGFNNSLQQADDARFRAKRYWAEILRDIVRDGGKGVDDKGRLSVHYVSHAGTGWEQTHRGLWAPKNGYWVPTGDGVFHKGTLVPFETVQDRKEALRRLEAKGIPAEQLSFFYRLDSYRNDERFVGRDFDPDSSDYGRFYVAADGLPSFSGDVEVSSRPAYDKPEIVMEVAEPI